MKTQFNNIRFITNSKQIKLLQEKESCISIDAWRIHHLELFTPAGKLVFVSLLLYSGKVEDEASAGGMRHKKEEWEMFGSVKTKSNNSTTGGQNALCVGATQESRCHINWWIPVENGFLLNNDWKHQVAGTYNFF